jgi:sugar phosphate isomerase/epimerase
VQVKDGRGRGADWTLTPIGAGEVPLGTAFGLLMTAGFGGAISVEWERAWHPELDPPEVALPGALKVVRRLLETAVEPIA